MTRPALARCALLGVTGATLVLVGAAQAASPFVSKVPGSWFFGVPGAARPGATDGAAVSLGVLCVWTGIAVLLVAWYRIVRATPSPTVTPRALMGVLGAWLVPVALCPPLFSRDVYAYVAQGELLAHGISPYRRGPAALADPGIVSLVDPMWRHATAPYGPLFMGVSELSVTVARHHALAAVAVLRVVCVASVGVVALATAVIARAVDADPGRAVALVALNPLVVLVFVGGAHNDALMVAFLAAGVACAARRRAAAGIVLCAVGAAVKVPALVGVLYIGWVWAGPGAPLRARLERLAGAVALGAGTLALCGGLAGLGWGWLWHVTGPGAVVSWLDPATAAGLIVNHAGAALGLGAHQDLTVRAARAVALAVTLAGALVLVGRAPRHRGPDAVGWSLLLAAVLGPVVWPWYAAWSVPFLATASRRAQAVVVVVSTWACFADVPPGRTLWGSGASVMALGVAAGVAVVVTAWRVGDPAALPGVLRRGGARRRAGVDGGAGP